MLLRGLWELVAESNSCTYETEPKKKKKHTTNLLRSRLLMRFINKILSESVHARCPFSRALFLAFYFFFIRTSSLSLSFWFFFSLSLSLLFSVSIGSPTLSDFLCTTEKIHRVTELDLYQKTLCFICFTQCKWFKLLFLFIFSSSTRIESYWVWNRVNFFNRMISFFLSWVECVLPIFVVEFFVAFENKNRVIFCAYRAIYDELYTTEFRLFSSNKMRKHVVLTLF